MTTIDAEAPVDTAEALQEDAGERPGAVPDDEGHAQEWRRRRASVFRHHRRIDRLGDVVAGALWALLLYAAFHTRPGH